MSNLLGTVDTTVPPDDGQIFIVAGEPGDVPVLDGDGGRFVGCASDVIVVISASELLHEAAVRLESWSAEPPRPDGEWDDVQSGRLSVSEDSVAVHALWETDLGERLRLAASGWHRVRVYVSGREALRRWDEQWDGRDEAPAGLERFVVQLWPEAPTAVQQKTGRVAQLTAGDIALMSTVRDEWIGHGLSTAPAERNEAERGVREAYRAAGLPEPAVLWLGSPLAGCLALYLSGGGNPVQDEAVERVRRELRGLPQVDAGGTVTDRILGGLTELVRSRVSGRTQLRVNDELVAPIVDRVVLRVREQAVCEIRQRYVAGIGDTMSSGGWGQHAANWYAEWDFYDRVGGVGRPGLDALLRIARSAGWWWPLANLAILTDRPTAMHLDDKGDLHNPDGPALLYPDGWAVRATHGVRT
jgi:Arc/MetJ family transcription regulator